MPDRFYTVQEVAQTFGVTARTVRYWVDKGRMKGIQPGGPGGDLRIPRSEVDRFLSLEVQPESANDPEA